MTTTPKKPCILLVDDEPSNLKLLREILRNDYNLLFARNCSEMLRGAVEQPDLILLDVMMPVMDGYTGCAMLKANEATHHIPVIFVTAQNEMENEVKGFEVGAVDYITKPVQGPVVRARIATHLALRKAQEIIVQQNEELKENARLRDDVEQIVRHDLKGPLNAIIGMPSVLINQLQLSANQKQLFDIIVESGYRLLDMINRSHDLYKMERGIYQLDAQAVDLLVVLNHVATELQELIRKKKLLYMVHLNGKPVNPGDTFIVSGEELLYHSMLCNLLKNAIEASPCEESLLVFMDHGERPVLRISNKGSVPLDIRDKFFDKYVTSGKIQGTGLGTYSAKLIAMVSGGEIHLDTTREGETSIVIQLIQ